jgi:hypothetical protein
MVLPISAPATENPSPCLEIISACDAAIEKRNELINLQATRINELKDDNDRLTNAVLTLRDENKNGMSREITYGAVGIVVGVLAYALIKK